MVNYNLGKIYKIVCKTTGLVYIGSTTQPTLARRLATHSRDYKSFLNEKQHFVTSFKILENNNYEIILIETYPCNSKDELHARERYYIENNECVNKHIPTRTKKEYYEQNRDKIIEQKKEYRDTNKDKIAEQKKEYYEPNKYKIKEHYDKNKQKIEEQKKPYTCECGSVFRIDAKSRHLKTLKHQQYEKEHN